MHIYKSALIFVSLLSYVICAKILAVFPIASISHQIVFRPLTQELARRGHEVVVITTDPAFRKGQSPKNLTEIDLHDVSYGFWWKNLQETIDFGTTDSLNIQIKIIIESFAQIVEMQLKLPEVQDVLRAKYDLLIVEACPRQALIYSHAVKAPVIQISSFGMMMGSSNYIVGAPSNPLIYPTGFSQRLYNLTIWEKVNELYKHVWVDYLFDKHEEQENAMFKRIFGENAPTLDELRNNVDLLMLNMHPMWADNQPWPPNVVSIWGINEKTSKELPQDLKLYLDSSKNGVIYFSLGSNAQSSTLPKEKIQMLMNTFANLPYDVLWKWEKDEMPGKPDNVKISKWLPQSDLLQHPKIKLFITQGGLQSTGETINSEVPVVGIPMLGDQWYNVQKYEYYKIGIGVNFETITEEGLQSAIETVINDPSYKQNIAKLRILLNDQPQSALDRAVWWTEYVLRHGGAKHLRSPAANMPWTQYYQIEIILLLLSIVIIGLLITICTFNILLKYTMKKLA